jgi:hypothetical protein
MSNAKIAKRTLTQQDEEAVDRRDENSDEELATDGDLRGEIGVDMRHPGIGESRKRKISENGNLVER